MSNPPSLLFRLVGLAAALFVLTVFVMIAGLFSDPDLSINLWLNRYGLLLLLVEVGLLMLLGLGAMLSDRPIQETPESDRSPHPRCGGDSQDERAGVSSKLPSPIAAGEESLPITVSNDE